MRLFKNRVIDDHLHESLISGDPWGDAKSGRFIGRLIIDDGLCKDENNVGVYEFDVFSLVDEFIESHVTCSGVFTPESEIDAKIIISDLEHMVNEMRKRFNA